MEVEFEMNMDMDMDIDMGRGRQAETNRQTSERMEVRGVLVETEEERKRRKCR